MLVLTDAAAEVVKAITSSSPAPGDAGLRIASAIAEPAGPGDLQLAAADGPSGNDQVIDAAGALIYLEPQAAAYLDDKILDAQVDQQGNPQFSLGIQGPDPV